MNSKLLECVAPDDISDLGVFLSAPLSLDSYDFTSSLRNTKWFQLDADMFKALQKLAPRLEEDSSSYF